MNHLERIAAHLGELDAVLLTGASNCYYATGFMGEGAALVSRRGSVYITDSRYTEAAEKAARPPYGRSAAKRLFLR